MRQELHIGRFSVRVTDQYDPEQAVRTITLEPKENVCFFANLNIL